MTRLQLRLVRFAYSGPTATWPLGGSPFGVSAANGGPPSGPSADDCVFSAPGVGDATGDRPLAISVFTARGAVRGRVA